MASKTTTTAIKFEVEKFDGKINFLLWKMRVTSLLVKEGSYPALQGIRKKPSTMDEDDWKEIDGKAKATIILCLSDEVLYNVLNEDTADGMWNRLESLYMTKSLSNKLYVKKQLYYLRMAEGTPILQHLNVFNKILNDLLALEVKIAGRGSDRGERSGKPEASVVEEDLCEVSMAQSGRKKTSDIWLLDPACTYHVCPRRE